MISDTAAGVSLVASKAVGEVEKPFLFKHLKKRPNIEKEKSLIVNKKRH